MDFVRLTFPNGNPVCIRISQIVHFHKVKDGPENHRSMIYFDSERSHNVQETVDEILELLEGRKEYGSIGIPNGLPPDTIIGQVDDVEIDTFPPSTIPLPPPAPPGPPGCVRREAGTPWGPFCPTCQSDMKRKYWIVGRLLGCINEDCKNYWRKSDDHTPDES